MNKAANPFEMPEELRKAIDDNMAQAKSGFEKVMEVAGEAAKSLEGKTGAAQAQALELREKTLAFTKSNVNAAFELAGKLAKAQSMDELMRLQAEYMTRQFTSVRNQIQDAGEMIQAQTRAVAAEVVEGTKTMQNVAKSAMENASTAAKPAAKKSK